MAATEEGKKPRKEPVHKHPPYVEVGSPPQSLLTATQAAKDSALSWRLGLGRASPGTHPWREAHMGFNNAVTA